MKNIRIYLLLTIVLISPLTYADNLVMITSLDNTENIEIKDVARIFLGKVTSYPSGEEVVPLDIHPSDPSYEEFARVVLKKSMKQMRAYWAKRTFTGKGLKPRVIETKQDLLALVSEDKRYLSYVDSKNTNHTVRWVIELEQ